MNIKNFFLPLAILLGMTMLQYSHAEYWTNAMTSDVSNYITQDQMIQSPDGSFYLMGRFHGQQNFSGTTYSAINQDIPYIMKASATGEFLWFNIPVYTSPDVAAVTVDQRVTQIASDSQNNLFVAGYLYGSGYIGGTHYPKPDYTADYYNGYLIKYNPAGTVIWEHRVPDVYSSIWGVATDENDNIYLMTEHFASTDSFLGISSSSTGAMSITKLNSQGVLQWEKEWDYDGTTYWIYPETMTVKDDFIYVAGRYQGNMNWDGNTFSNIDGYDTFYGKVSTTNGTVEYFKSIGGIGSDDTPIGRALEVNDAGELYMLSNNPGNITIGNTSFTNSDGEYDGFVTKFSQTGEVIWTHRVVSVSDGATGYDALTAEISIDQYNNIVIAGSAGAGNVGNPTFPASATIEIYDQDTGEDISGVTSLGYLVRIDANGDLVDQQIYKNTNRMVPATAIISGTTVFMAGSYRGDAQIGIEDLGFSSVGSSLFLARRDICDWDTSTVTTETCETLLQIYNQGISNGTTLERPANWLTNNIDNWSGLEIVWGDIQNITIDTMNGVVPDSIDVLSGTLSCPGTSSFSGNISLILSQWVFDCTVPVLSDTLTKYYPVVNQNIIIDEEIEEIDIAVYNPSNNTTQTDDGVNILGCQTTASMNLNAQTLGTITLNIAAFDQEEVEALLEEQLANPEKCTP